jgi:hypothetical protein
MVGLPGCLTAHAEPRSDIREVVVAVPTVMFVARTHAFSLSISALFEFVAGMLRKPGLNVCIASDAEAGTLQKIVTLHSRALAA